MSAEKTWDLGFTINSLPAAHHFQFVTVNASNVGLAVNRGWAEIKKRPHVKGRRVEMGKISFSQRKLEKED